MSLVVAAAALCRPGPGTDRGRGGPLTGGWVAVDGGHIVEVGSGDPPSGSVDVGGRLLAPGLVDVQCNGVGGDDFAVGDPEGWARAGRTLAEHGVTSYCATVVSTDRGRYGPLLAAAEALTAEDRPGTARCLGMHLEGPFLGDAPGAHDRDHISDVDLPWLDALLDRHPGLVRIVTLAPEADPTFAAVRSLSARGVTVALGHSLASYDVARAAVDAGASVATHLFNAMGPLGQREPGIAGVALDDERLTPTLIGDMVHVHPALVRLAFARRANVALVSDSVAVGGDVAARGGAAYRDDGTLAGATLLLDGAVAAVTRAGIAPARAIEAATWVPSELVARPDVGRLEPGARADLVALDPDTLSVERVWAGGEEVDARRRQ